MIKFTIPGELPTMNEIVEVSKSHHMRYASMKKEYTYLVQMCAYNLPKVKLADYEIIWYCKNRRKDKDNIMSGQKFIFDGLVQAGVIENDGWDQIGDVTHAFEVDKVNPRVEVRIKELEGIKK
jgi:Holliday junction resolvase RusA-like endonuclease